MGMGALIAGGAEEKAGSFIRWFTAGVEVDDVSCCLILAAWTICPRATYTYALTCKNAE